MNIKKAHNYMKRINLLFVSLMVSAAISSCVDKSEFDSVPRDPNYGTGVGPKVVSVTPEANATGLDTINTIEICYDKNIFRTPETTIQLNGEYLDSGVVAEGNKLIIPCHTKGNTTYELIVKTPTVRDENYNFASDYSFKFSTRMYNEFKPELFDITPNLCNPNATEATKRLYAYLVEQFGKKTISSAMAEVNWNIDNAEKIYRMSGKYPAINTFDFIHHYFSKPLGNANWIDYTDTKVVDDWWKNGGIVSCMWHWMVPYTKDDVNNIEHYTTRVNMTDEPNTTFKCRNATRNNTWERQVADRDLEVIAGYLLALQEKGIPVIWRPLHEASGNTNASWNLNENGESKGNLAWFWWGGDGSVQFKKLWQRMYNVFKEKGINNLIWVWTSCMNDAEWYPGDDYVDIIAYDYYENDEALYHTAGASYFEELRQITGGRKLITLGECGAVPSPENMLSSGAVWSWFMPWYGIHMSEPYNSADFFNTQMNSQYVITRDQLPDFK